MRAKSASSNSGAEKAVKAREADVYVTSVAPTGASSTLKRRSVS